MYLGVLCKIILQIFIEITSNNKLCIIIDLHLNFSNSPLLNTLDFKCFCLSILIISFAFAFILRGVGKFNLGDLLLAFNANWNFYVGVKCNLFCTSQFLFSFILFTMPNIISAYFWNLSFALILIRFFDLLNKKSHKYYFLYLICTIYRYSHML